MEPLEPQRRPPAREKSNEEPQSSAGFARGTEKAIGLTTAIGAVLLAAATLLGNRTHVEEGKLQTEITDLMSAYNSKHSLTHTFMADTQQAELGGKIGGILASHMSAKGPQQEKLLQEIDAASSEQAQQFRAAGEQEDREADEIQKKDKELERQAELIDQSGDIYNLAELFLQVSIVLCSIALLAESRIFWRVSFVSSALGVGLMLYGLLLR
jgi:Domain of unknown function (DUF4337)